MEEGGPLGSPSFFVLSYLRFGVETEAKFRLTAADNTVQSLSLWLSPAPAPLRLLWEDSPPAEIDPRACASEGSAIPSSQRSIDLFMYTARMAALAGWPDKIGVIRLIQAKKGR